MSEANKASMQEIMQIGIEQTNELVHGIENNRHIQRGKMHAYLVLAACHRPYPEMPPASMRRQ